MGVNKDIAQESPQARRGEARQLISLLNERGRERERRQESRMTAMVHGKKYNKREKRAYIGGVRRTLFFVPKC